MDISRVLFMPDCLSLIWGHSVHFTPSTVYQWKPKFQNAASPTVSVRFQQNFMVNMIVMGEYRLLRFWRSAKNCKNYGTLKFFLTQDHMELEISNATSPTVFIELYEDIAYHGVMQAITLLDNRPSFTKLYGTCKF